MDEGKIKKTFGACAQNVWVLAIAARHGAAFTFKMKKPPRELRRGLQCLPTTTQRWAGIKIAHTPQGCQFWRGGPGIKWSLVLFTRWGTCLILRIVK
jgi:hypothetical protein